MRTIATTTLSVKGVDPVMPVTLNSTALWISNAVTAEVITLLIQGNVKYGSEKRRS